MTLGTSEQDVYKITPLGKIMGDMNYLAKPKKVYSPFVFSNKSKQKIYIYIILYIYASVFMCIK